MKAVSGATWPTVLASEESPFIDIWIHLKTFSGDYSDDSMSEIDDYLTKDPQPMIRRLKTGYYSSQRESTRDRWYKQTTMHRGAIPFRVTRGGTKDSRRSTQRPRRSRSRLRTGTEITAAGLAGAAIVGLYGHRKAKQGQKQSQGTSDAPGPAGVVADKLSGANETAYQDNVPAEEYSGGGEGTLTQENKSAEVDSERHLLNVRNNLQPIHDIPEDSSQNPDSSNTLSFIQEADEGIVEEPESYVATVQPEQGQSSTRGNSMAVVRYERRAHRPLQVLERRRSSYTRGDSLALVPFKERQSSMQHERRPLAARENARPYRFTPRPASETRRYATLESNYEDSRVRSRRLLQPRRRGLLMGNYRETDTRQHQSLNFRQNYEDRRPLASYSRRNTNEDSHISMRSSNRPFRHVRGRPAAGGIVKNATRDDDLETSIYYMPRRTRKSVPTVNTPGHPNSEHPERSFEENRSDSEHMNRSNSMPNHVRSSRSSERSAEASHREQRSGSFNSSHTATLIKSSVLPILSK